MQNKQKLFKFLFLYNILTFIFIFVKKINYNLFFDINKN